MKNFSNTILTFAFVMCGILLCGEATPADARYFGATDAVQLKITGCNAVAYTPVPGENNLFIGRAFFKSDGTPVRIEEGCASPEVKEAVSANRGGLVLDELNWNAKAFNIVKPLLVAPAKITRGPLEGATIKSAHDAYAILYHGQYLVAFECLPLQARDVHGTSSCLTVFDDARKELLLNQIHVVVSGNRTDPGQVFHSSSVPALLVFNDRLYIYWSEIAQISPEQKKWSRIGVRGAELEADRHGLFWVKGTGGKAAYSTGSESIEVWGPDSSNTMSDSAVDLKAVWLSKSGIVALSGLGGSGCVRQGPQPGCFRMALAKSDRPLGDHIFNKSPLLDEGMLPTNGQGYTRPIKNPDGGYSFIGVFYKPTVNGFSELRPVPKDWTQATGGNYAFVVFPFPDENLWPAQ